MGKENSNINDLIARSLSNELNEEEQKEFEAWLNENKSNQMTWNILTNVAIDDDFFDPVVKLRTISNINSRISSNQKEMIISFIRNWYWAASIILFIGIGILSYQLGLKNNRSKYVSKTIKVNCPLGVRSTIKLPDSTVIVLNAGTILEYPDAFGPGNREIYLKGEAYFEVAKDPKHPFIVKTDKFNIKVLGTHFNVKSYDNEQKDEVTLLEGSVGLTLKGSDTKQLILKPNQQALINKSDNNISVKNIESKIYTSWIKGHLKFKAIRLSEIARQIERKFNVKIIIKSESLRNELYTGDFIHDENLDQILRIINTDKRIVYKIKDKIIELDEK